MKLVTFDGTPFAESLRSLLGSIVAQHPDNETILEGIAARRIAVRVIVDQTANVLTVGATLDTGEQRIVATVDMAAGASAWRVVYPDWTPAPEIDATVH